MQSYEIDLPLGAAGVVLVMLRLGSIRRRCWQRRHVQALAVAGVRLFGYDRAEATGFATLLFVVVTAPLWIGGFNCLDCDAHETRRHPERSQRTTIA